MRTVSAAIAIALVALLLAVALVPVYGHPRPGYPMHIIATSPPEADDILAGEGYMFDGTRWTGYVITTGDYVLCNTANGPQCGLLPAGTVFLVPAMPDSM